MGQFARPVRSYFLLFAVAFCLEARPVPALAAADAEVKAATEAFDLAEKKKWAEAHTLASGLADPLVGKVLDWLEMSKHGTKRSFEEISAFLEANPSWPLGSRIQSRAEEAITAETPNDRIKAFFTQRSPLTVKGKTALADALLAEGDEAGAADILREAWVNDNFDAKGAVSFVKKYKTHLTKDDHLARLDRLLWDRRIQEAGGMLFLVDGSHQRLAKARIALIGRRGNVDAAVTRVPQELQNDPGLVYERLRWRRRAKMVDGSEELFATPAVDQGRPDKWWGERALAARQALSEGKMQKAYDFVKTHGDLSVSDFAEAEWLAGWIALRFLNDPDAAYIHFKAMYDNVGAPVSLARGAYWMGRAAEARGAADLAKQLYETAAPHGTTYYGQLAAMKLGGPDKWQVPTDPNPSPADLDAFEGQELVKVVELLGRTGQQKHMRWFVLKLNDLAETPGFRVLTAQLATENGRPDLAVWVARRSFVKNTPMVASGYPLIDLPTSETPEKALALALIRQESNFFAEAISPAGARGLMQLMPRTARKVSKTLNIRYSKSRLTTEPHYNITLGTAFLKTLLEDYEGSYILAMTAYNAGPHRVDRWLKLFGDPRKGEVDPVDWVELIPYSETRNYVQRVLEGVQVYRRRLGGTNVTLALEADLQR